MPQQMPMQQPQMMGAPAPPPPGPVPEWVSTYTPEGHVYYYNERTGETAWQLPPGARCRDAGAQQQSQYGYGQQAAYGQQQWGQQQYYGGGYGQGGYGGGW
mmetsp:Transcript_25362/g.45080  ORF Transcript_25362/g.45080 Transcript_25362/m.45080 type:complete len:101 (+) Transcript_25362:1-303(+)